MRPDKPELGDWQGLNSPGQNPRYRTISEMLRRHDCDQSVLDVGCGEALLRSWLPDHSAYTGIEPSSSAAQIARARNPSARIIHSSAEEFEPPVAGFASIVFNEMLYYAHDPVGLLQKYSAAAQSSRAILCSVYQKPESPSLKRRLWNWIDRRRPLSNLHCEQIVRDFMMRARWTILDDRSVLMPGTSQSWHIWLAAPHRQPAMVVPE